MTLDDAADEKVGHGEFRQSLSYAEYFGIKIHH
jgi:hypothetical protein